MKMLGSWRMLVAVGFGLVAVSTWTACKDRNDGSSLRDMSDTGVEEPPSQTSPDSARSYRKRLEASMMDWTEMSAYAQVGLVIDLAGVQSSSTFRFQYDVAFEATLRVILAGNIEGDSILNSSGEFNFPSSEWRVFVGECEIKPVVKNAVSANAEVLVYGTGGGVSALNGIEHSVSWIQNFYIRDGDTVAKIKEQCLGSLKQAQAENLKAQLADWIKATQRVGSKGGVNLYNNTGLSVKVIAPDGGESWVATRTQSSYPQAFINKTFQVWYRDTCYRWTPTTLDKGYWVELLTWGLRGCGASQGCVDVTNDDGPGPVGHGSKC